MGGLCHASEMGDFVDCECAVLVIHVLQAVFHRGIHCVAAWLYHLLFCSAKTSPFHLFSIDASHDNQPLMTTY